MAANPSATYREAHNAANVVADWWAAQSKSLEGVG